MLGVTFNNSTNLLHEGIFNTLDSTLERTSERLGRQAIFNVTERLATLPPYLAVHYKRFMSKNVKTVAKILRTCKYQVNGFDVFNFCTEPLKAAIVETRSKLNAIQDRVQAAVLKGEELSDEQKQQNAAELAAMASSETGIYDLVAVVTHAGRTADGGHYIAHTRIDGRPGEWYCFDDEDVSVKRDADVENLAGGGDWHSAYFVLYRKRKPGEVPQVAAAPGKGKK